MKKTLFLFILFFFPVLARADESVLTHNMTKGSDSAEQIGLSTYIIQSISSLNAQTAGQKQLKACVATISDFAPGGGDTSHQQRGFASSMTMAQIMAQGMEKARNQNRAVASCADEMSSLKFDLTGSGQAPIDRTGECGQLI